MAATKGAISVYAETVPGLAEVAWLEIRKRLPGAEFGAFLFARDERGIVHFTHHGAMADLLTLRTVKGLYLTATFQDEISRGYRDLNRLPEQMIRSGDLGRAVNLYTRFRRRQPGSYQLVARTYGRHEYDRNQFRQAVIRAIEGAYPGWRRVQRGGDVEIQATVLGSQMLVGLRLPGLSRRQDAPPGLDPTLAAAAVLLAEPAAGERFLDLLCGAGPILAEGAAQRPAGEETGLLLGGDPAWSALRIAQAHTGRRAALCQWHAHALPLPRAAFDKLVTLLPAAPPEKTREQYGAWLSEMQRVLRAGALAIVLTHQHDLFRDVLRAYPGLQIQGGYSVRWEGKWGRLYVLTATPS